MDVRLDPGHPPPSPAPPGREGERLRQLFAAHQNFLGHDLPNQLVAIQAYARLLEEPDGARPEDEPKWFARRIGALSEQVSRQARRLAEIGVLLRESPWGPPLSPREVAAEVVAAARCRPDAARIEFRLPEDAALPLAEGLLHRVLDELVANAVAAIGPGREGRIDLTAGGGAIRVSDTGRGIAPERLEALTRPTHAGGLLLVHQAAALWGGHLHVESAVGRGTTITVTTGGRG